MFIYSLTLFDNLSIINVNLSVFILSFDNLVPRLSLPFLCRAWERGWKFHADDVTFAELLVVTVIGSLLACENAKPSNNQSETLHGSLSSYVISMDSASSSCALRSHVRKHLPPE